MSDIHGDGRVHELTSAEEPSGFGFELTMRLQREPGERSPPTWPAAIMQSLAKYVFQSGNYKLKNFFLFLIGAIVVSFSGRILLFELDAESYYFKILQNCSNYCLYYQPQCVAFFVNIIF